MSKDCQIRLTGTVSPAPFIGYFPYRLVAAYQLQPRRIPRSTGATIQAYCSSCDYDWEMSTEKRADLARALNR